MHGASLGKQQENRKIFFESQKSFLRFKKYLGILKKYFVISKKLIFAQKCHFCKKWILFSFLSNSCKNDQKWANQCLNSSKHALERASNGSAPFEPFSSHFKLRRFERSQKSLFSLFCKNAFLIFLRFFWKNNFQKYFQK